MSLTITTPVLTAASTKHTAFDREFIQGSAIHPSLYAATVQVVGDLEQDAGGDAATPIHDALNWRYVRFGHTVNTTLLAALFLNEDGSYWQAKLSEPKQDRKTGKTRKYETPVGNGARAYLPSVPPEIRQKVNQRQQIECPTEGSFWDFIAQHPEIPIVLTEGGKKSLAALSQGFVAIALYGINAGVNKYETIGGERIRRLQPELIPDLQRFAGTGRPFTLAFDQDTKPKTRHKVASALADLSWHLEQQGCTVRIATWEGQSGQCKGLDDLIVNAGAEAWQNAYQQAIPAREWRIMQQLAAQIKRQPDLAIGTQEFSEVAPNLPKAGILALYGGKGTGKSEAIKQILTGQSWLSVTPLVSLGRDQGEAWGGVFINDGDIIGSQLLKDGQPVHGASVCIPSLTKVNRIEADVLVLDELTATLEFLLGSKLANKNGLRPVLLDEFIRRVQRSEQVILADADLTEEAIAYIEAIRGERAYLVRSDRQALTYPTWILEGTQPQAIAALTERFQTLPTQQLIYLNCDSKTLADSLAKLLQAQGISSLLITSDTSGCATEAEFLASQGRMLPTLIRQGIRAIITSPTVTQGFNIKAHTELIDSVWGFYKGGSITAHAMAQALDRVRSNDVPRFVHVAKKGSAYSKLSKAQAIAPFLKEFKQISTAAARLVRHQLNPMTLNTVDGLDWQSQNLKLLASLEVRRNRGMVALRDTLVALLRQEGKQVQSLRPTVPTAATKAASRELKAAQQQVTQAQAQAVAQATPIDDAEAKRLSEQTTPLTPEQLLSLTQWQLARFYRLDNLTATDVLFDKKGVTQHHIRNLEAALSQAKAEERTAHSIHQNPDTPQDWDKAAVHRWMMEQCGILPLVVQIVRQEVTQFTPEITAPISQFVRNHATEFRIGFGYAKLDKMSDQQIVGILLGHYGIRSKRHRRRNAYSVDQAHLEALLNVLKRRQQADPQGAKKESNPEVWISLESPMEEEREEDGQKLKTSDLSKRIVGSDQSRGTEAPVSA
ncbi:plasmid replication protein, CyRepA1 family [Alkalinema sp. FACHB-956]|uniref:plasmid replication protein, CyRepA1 family n=1 Tax=Alkalinema sp. FACHB-956 TaxID=2692768 RepID=UPI001684E6E6|nr:plasmid replication protein, CyRepA1 family [Alkalinema sp. FACHB-956]MBD2329670.1 DUF3854 domain-containing protein [Alkalinema sp. FACHB-956]